MNGLFLFLLAAVTLVAGVIGFYIYMERKKKKDIKKKFKKYSESYKLSKKDMRTVPRVTIPQTIDVGLALTDEAYFGLKANAADMSLSGFSVNPAFPLKKLPLNVVINNILVTTPISTFVVKTMSTVRIEHQPDKRLLAFRIEEIDSDQFEILKNFMTYLDNFLKDEEDN